MEGAGLLVRSLETNGAAAASMKGLASEGSAKGFSVAEPALLDMPVCTPTSVVLEGAGVDSVLGLEAILLRWRVCEEKKRQRASRPSDLERLLLRRGVSW